PSRRRVPRRDRPLHPDDAARRLAAGRPARRPGAARRGAEAGRSDTRCDPAGASAGPGRLPGPFRAFRPRWPRARRACPPELADALANARTTRAAWSRAAGTSVDLRDVERRQVFDVVRLRIEGGARYLRGPLEAYRRTVLETAASRAAGLPDETDRRLAVVA